MKSSAVLRFSPFTYNPANSRPNTGRPSGAVNRMISAGLPPWAAWCSKLNRYTRFRMSGVAERSFLPMPPHKMDVIWMNERVRERVRTSREYRYVYKQNQYPYVRTGLHFSDALDHWVQVPMVQSAMLEVEKDGGFDNFITKRRGSELKSRYGERIRRHILVRQKEIQKNFVLQQHATALADTVSAELAQAKGREATMAVFEKYGIVPEEFFRQLAERIRTSRRVAEEAPPAAE